jgi:inosine-uridine nucleoside N-ribohydrolase
LDATGRLIVTQAYLDAIKTDLRTPEARWVDALLLTLQQQMGPVFDGYSLWDPYAAAVLVDQERYAANVTTVPITVVTQAVNVSEAGRTMPDLHGAPIDVVLSANDLIFDDLFAYYNVQLDTSCSSSYAADGRPRIVAELFPFSWLVFFCQLLAQFLVE